MIIDLSYFTEVSEGVYSVTSFPVFFEHVKTLLKDLFFSKLEGKAEIKEGIVEFVIKEKEITFEGFVEPIELDLPVYEIQDNSLLENSTYTYRFWLEDFEEESEKQLRFEKVENMKNEYDYLKEEMEEEVVYPEYFPPLKETNFKLIQEENEEGYFTFCLCKCMFEKMKRLYGDVRAWKLFHFGYDLRFKPISPPEDYSEVWNED